jgi:hypothetical protein
MAQSVQIHCINKTPRTDPHDRIEHVGGVNADGTRWKMTQPAAIAAIEAGTYQFFVSVRGDSVWVVVATSRWGNKYLKTQNDGDQPNNLLSLPECP